MDLELHPVQAKILNTLLFKIKAKFSDLNSEGLESDHFVFHINRVVTLGLVEKSDDGQYLLTAGGKEYANRFNTEKAKIEKQPKIGVLIICAKKTKGRTEFLVQKRLKQPYYGYHGFITGKIRFGETLMETVAREFKEETGLEATGFLAIIEHKMDYSLENSLLEDKFFFVVQCTKFKGVLREKFEGGENLWLTKRQILDLENLFDDVRLLLKLVSLHRQGIRFIENKYHVKGF